MAGADDVTLDRAAAVAWLRRCVDAGEGGKVLLAAIRDGVPQAAWAAGLCGSQDHPHFITFARYALQGLLSCNGYWLMVPDQVEGTRGYRCQLKYRGSGLGLEAWQGADGWSWRETDEPRMLEDLLVPGANLPGIMRRELAALADSIEIDPPLA